MEVAGFWGLEKPSWNGDSEGSPVMLQGERCVTRKGQTGVQACKTVALHTCKNGLT